VKLAETLSVAIVLVESDSISRWDLDPIRVSVFEAAFDVFRNGAFTFI
jgi:hypothetical protein